MEVLPDFKLHQPTSLAEALKVRGSVDDARYISGGTDLMANLRRGLTPTENLIDLTGVRELRSIVIDDDGLHIGAAVTLADIAGNDDVRRDYQAVAMAAGEVAGPTHREAATIGGNLCLDTRCFFYNQSQWWRDSNDGCMKYEGTICHVVPTSARCYAAYSGDVAPALLVLEAEVDIAGPQGTRRLPLADLFLDDGIDYLALKDGEMVTVVHIPGGSGLTSAYAKLKIRGSIDFPLAGVALAVALDKGKISVIRAAFTGTKSLPLAITGLEDFVGTGFDEDDADSFAKLVQKQIAPLHTTTTQPQYRRRAVTAMARRLAIELKGAAAG
jgi:4-hydroxybenzoyl-CoA reductase subunit beta